MTGPYAAALEACVFMALPERGVLAVSGPDRQKFLHNLLSNEIKGRSAGESCLAALMDTKGHLVALMRVLVSSDAVLLEMPVNRLGTVETLLVHYKVAAPVRFAPRPASVIAVLGPALRETLGRAGLVLPELGAGAHLASEVAGIPVRVARAADLPCGACVLHVEPASGPALAEALLAAGAVSLDRDSFDALRIEQGRPLYGPDVGEDNLLHETGLVAEYHSPAKGCYVGQEVVARLEARGGNVNKLLRGLRLSAAAAAGEPITAEGREVGRVTSAAVSPRLGPIAMGYVHRSHAAPDATVTLGGGTARVQALPMSV